MKNFSQTNITLESHSCPLGCEGKDKLILTGRDRMHNLPGKFTVVRCKKCGLIRTNPRPTLESIVYYYPDSYTPYLSTKINFESKKEQASFWKNMFSGMFRFKVEVLPLLPPGQMLEIGCASGKFLHQMATKGWQVEGIELNENAAKSARALGYNVYAGPIERAPEPKQKYDVIIGWMVLEHLHEPFIALQKMKRWLKPNGWLVLSVTNASSLGFRIFKDSWYDLHLPNHLFHYSPQSIAGLLKKTGWDLRRIIYQRTAGDLVASAGYLLEEHGLFPALSRKLKSFPENPGKQAYCLYPFACILSLIGQTGRMTIWAKSSAKK